MEIWDPKLANFTKQYLFLYADDTTQVVPAFKKNIDIVQNYWEKWLLKIIHQKTLSFLLSIASMDNQYNFIDNH